MFFNTSSIFHFSSVFLCASICQARVGFLARRVASEALPAGTFYAVYSRGSCHFAFFEKSYVFCLIFLFFDARPFASSE